MIGALAALLSALALIDPRLRSLVWAALGLALFAVVRNPKRLFGAALAFALAIPSFTGFSVGADSLNYFAYTSSILADRDLDLANQWEALGLEVKSKTPRGLVPNAMSVGPGVIWLPAVALTHLWLAWTGGPVNALLLSVPYHAAAAVTTIAVLLASAFVLARGLASRFDRTVSVAAVSATLLASPILYYATIQPLMSHALTFAFSACCLSFVLHAENERTLRAWAWCGCALGLAMLCRAQAAPLGLLVIVGLFRARAGWKEALVAGVAAFIGFAPQLLSWRVLYGSFFTIPQGDNFIDWTRGHGIDVLISADRGLFNWHPILLLGLVGLAFFMRGLGAYGAAALAIFAFTAFLNGSVLDWNASAAFGARRFDLVLPLLGLGLAALLARARPLLARRPLLLPAAALLFATAWNISLIDLTRGKPPQALPLDDVASRQVEQARRAADATLGRLGPRTRHLIYRTFVGLATYENYRPGGDFDLATLEPRFVRQGWSSVQAWDDGALFRYVLHPRACIVIPLDQPFDLRGFVLARSPARIKGQRVSLVLNGRTLTDAELPAVWTEVPFDAPEGLWLPGENEFCIVTSRKRPGDENDDLAYAAAVIRIQLP